jgi:hypothetical protein
LVSPDGKYLELCFCTLGVIVIITKEIYRSFHFHLQVFVGGKNRKIMECCNTHAPTHSWCHYLSCASKFLFQFELKYIIVFFFHFVFMRHNFYIWQLTHGNDFFPCLGDSATKRRMQTKTNGKNLHFWQISNAKINLSIEICGLKRLDRFCMRKFQTQKLIIAKFWTFFQENFKKFLKNSYANFKKNPNLSM